MTKDYDEYKLTKRERFAKAALQGLIINPNGALRGGMMLDQQVRALTSISYIYADAMIEAGKDK